MSIPKKRFLTIDIESTGLDWKKDKLHGLGCSIDDDKQYYVHEVPKALADPSVPKVGHNVRFDLRFLCGLLRWSVAGPVHDTMTIAQLIDENRSVGLEALTLRYLGAEGILNKSEMDKICAEVGVKHVGELCRMDLEKSDPAIAAVISKYCKADVANTRRLLYALSAELKRKDLRIKEVFKVPKGPWDYYVEEAQPMEQVLLAMELRGIRTNPAAIELYQKEVRDALRNVEVELSTTYAREVRKVEAKLLEKARGKRKTEKGKANVTAGSERYSTLFKWSSGQHVASLLFDHLSVRKDDVPKTKGGLRSTSDQDLSQLRARLDPHDRAGEFIDKFQGWRKSAKLLNTYVEDDSSLLSEVHQGRVFANYLQAGSSKQGGKGGTATGRLSSQNPNMQNLPRGSGVKRFFVPDTDGHVFLYFDYSQVELRIAAHVSEDEELVGAYQRKDDLHKITAASMFSTKVDKVTKDQRQAAKTVNFAMIYDASAFRLHGELGPLGYTVEDCEDFRKAFFEQFSGYKQYLREQLALVRKYRAVVADTGRVRRLPDIEFGNYLNWQTRTLNKMPSKLKERLYFDNDKVEPDDYELFNRARKKYNHACKQCYNFRIQCLGASITKRALIKLHGLGYDIVTTVHDSIVLQVARSEAEDKLRFVQRVMEGIYPLRVPLIAEGKVLNSLDESDIVMTQGADGTFKEKEKNTCKDQEDPQDRPSSGQTEHLSSRRRGRGDGTSSSS